MSVRCLVADDHPALLAAVSAYLGQRGFEVVGPATNGLDAVELAERERPELALVDFRMPRLGGVELVRALQERSPETVVAVYTGEADERLAAETLDAGAAAVVLKEAPLGDLVRALDAIVEGRTYVDPGVLGRQASRADTLTVRETQVLTLLAEGRSHESIGATLGISVETVRTHARKAADRLGARTRTQAVATALRRGLIA